MATPTAGPTPTARVVEQTVVVVQTATPTAVPGLGAQTERVNGYRWIQNKPNWRVPPKRGGTFTYAFIQSRSIDMILSRSFTVATMGTPIYSQLVRCNLAPLQTVGDIGICEPAPDLADSWEVVGDGKTWRFKLNQAAKWQDIPSTAFGYDSALSDLYGRDLVAADVVHSVNYWLGNLTKSDGSPQGTPTGGLWGNILGANAIDENTVEIMLEVPDPLFPATLSDWQNRILSPEVFNLDGDYQSKPVGTGAFIMDSRDQTVKTEFIPNPNFWRNGGDGNPLPYLDRYVVAVLSVPLARSAMITGQVDAALTIGVSTPSSAINFGRDCQACQIVEMFSAQGIFALGWRTEGPGAPFADKNARLAIAKAIDWNQLIINVHEGAAALQPPTASAGLIFDVTATVANTAQFLRDAGVPDEENPYVFDADLAKQLWAQSGHSPGEDHEIIYNEYSAIVTNQTIAIAGELEKNLDINVDVNKVPDIQIYYSAVGFLGGTEHQQFPSMAMYFNNVVPTTAGSLATMVGDEQRNFAEFDNADINALVEEISAGVSLAREKEIATEVFLIELRDELRRIVYPSAARFIIFGGTVRNFYNQSKGGECCHQGGNLLELIWLDA
ncbi:MAG: ABC transporter substrate-binding protein [Chloroflexi bacterium]|nr:ABC transporter substrate-binding protein [Chloroflexota bacterium]